MRRQKGFTLVEIAIVLVIIGLLLGGILKGQELINSARVRNLADTATGIQAAYYGFIDRYRRIPGDWNATGATQAIGLTITDGGNDSGAIDNAAGANLWQELNALWVQLAAAGFIQGAYGGGLNPPTNANGIAPLNAYNNVMVMANTGDFLASPAPQLHLVLGAGIPVDVMQEMDLKLDDGTPDAGDLRSAVAAGALLGAPAQGAATCVTGAAPNAVWNIAGNDQSCNAVYIF